MLVYINIESRDRDEQVGRGDRVEYERDEGRCRSEKGESTEDSTSDNTNK